MSIRAIAYYGRVKITGAMTSLVIAAALAPSAMAQKADAPRVSATDTYFLSCTVWTGRDWTEFTERSARTQLAVSPNGLRAYGEVNVSVKDKHCQNTTTLNVAPGIGQPFKLVYTNHSAYSDGNGIRVIGWSPSGKKLVSDVNLWEYETDRGYSHVTVIYDSLSDSTKEIPALDEAVYHYFGPNCEFELVVTGWKTDDQILVKVIRTPKTDQYPQHFCVTQPRIFVFDLSTKVLRAESQSRVGKKP